MKSAVTQANNDNKKVTKANPEQDSRKERRKNADLWSYATNVIAVLSWIGFLFALVMSYYAAPETDYGVLRYYDIEVRQFWLTPLTGYLYIILWLSALGSYVALLVDKYRSRRRADNPHYNLMFLLLINITWLIVILYHLHK